MIYLKKSEQKNYLFIDKNHYVSPALTLDVSTIVTWGKLYLTILCYRKFHLLKTGSAFDQHQFPDWSPNGKN